MAWISSFLFSVSWSTTIILLYLFIIFGGGSDRKRKRKKSLAIHLCGCMNRKAIDLRSMHYRTDHRHILFFWTRTHKKIRKLILVQKWKNIRRWLFSLINWSRHSKEWCFSTLDQYKRKEEWLSCFALACGHECVSDKTLRVRPQYCDLVSSLRLWRVPRNAITLARPLQRNRNVKELISRANVSVHAY